MNTRHANDGRIDPDHYEESPSTGWRATYEILDADLDQFVAMTRTDKSERYRRKHRWGVST